jgi:PAS domain S-box-containing protein
MSGQVILLFVVTVIIAVTIAVILSNIARKESEVKGYRFKTREVEAWKDSNKSLTSAISEQLDNLSGIGDQKDVTGNILNIVNNELEKRTNLFKVELNQKFTKVVQETKQEIIEFQDKYNDIQKKYDEAVTEKKQTESVLRSIAEGLVVVNDKGEVILMNPAAEKLLGMKKEDKIGKPLLKDLKEEQLISLVKESSKGNKEIELASQKRDTKKILRSSSAVIEDEDGKTVGMVSVLSDVTKQRELERLKTDFVSNVTHELRTPLATIQNSIALMLDKSTGPLTETQEKFLSLIKRNLERLQHLVDDILDLSKIEGRKMRLNPKPSSMESIINEVCESMIAWARTKNITIEKLIPNDLPWIQIDALRIIQVLNNIIGNAIKYTTQFGKITVEAKFEKKNKQIVVSVADTGIGIAKEDLSKIFDKFQQVGEKVWTDLGGTGLGLSIAKEIIDLHGGEIWVESEKGKGTKFTFTLPATIP